MALADTIELTRELRLSLTPAAAEQAQPEAALNSWAGWPAAADLAPFLYLRITVAGRPDPRIGYLCDIKDLDRILQEAVLRVLHVHPARPDRSVAAEQLLRWLWRALPAAPAPGVVVGALQLLPSPYVSCTLRRECPEMIEYTEQFEFSAAHRLHCPELSAERNQEIFGKCNNPRGHGHNYVVEVTVAGAAPPGVSLRRHLQAVVKERVLDRFDHKHLNEDTAEFRQLNPTVENITRVTWELLAQALAPVRLLAVRVYETPKTWAEYRGA